MECLENGRARRAFPLRPMSSEGTGSKQTTSPQSHGLTGAIKAKKSALAWNKSHMRRNPCRQVRMLDALCAMRRAEIAQGACPASNDVETPIESVPTVACERAVEEVDVLSGADGTIAHVCQTSGFASPLNGIRSSFSMKARRSPFCLVVPWLESNASDSS